MEIEWVKNTKREGGRIGQEKPSDCEINRKEQNNDCPW
jgi:hypothetical protein